jgi:hypothetical protein
MFLAFTPLARLVFKVLVAPTIIGAAATVAQEIDAKIDEEVERPWRRRRVIR